MGRKYYALIVCLAIWQIYAGVLFYLLFIVMAMCKMKTINIGDELPIGHPFCRLLFP